MIRRVVLAAVVAAVIPMMAACNDSAAKNNGTAATASAAGSGTLQDLAKCARQNGQPNYPDPVQDDAGTWGFPPSADGMEIPAACDSIRRQLGGKTFGPAPASTADMSKLRQFAKCVREHGLPDWPDPQPDGAFVLPDQIKQGGDQFMKDPVRACLDLAPDRHFRIAEPNSQGNN